MTEPGDMVRWLPFPFPGNRFPDQLGAVVQRTVLDRREPARVVIHDSGGHWVIGDGVNDPNEPDACIATHLNHVVQDDPSLEELAKMGPGHRADRAGRRDPWVIRSHSYDD